MENKKYYPQKKKKQYPQNQSITKPFAYDNRIKYLQSMELLNIRSQLVDEMPKI